MTVAAWIRGIPVGVVQAIKGAFDYPNSIGLTGAGTSSQANALPLPRDFNVFTSVSASTNGGLLPWGADQTVSSQNVAPPGTVQTSNGIIEIGDQITVVNNTASVALLIYPQTGGKIQGAAANAGFSVGANKTAFFFYIGSGNWVVNLSA